MTTPTPEMISKLPKWAQAEMEDLRRGAARAIATYQSLLDGQTPRNCWLSGHTLKIGERFYLQSERVTFKVGNGTVQVYPDEDRLQFMGSGTVEIRPHSGNVFSIGTL